ncbi:MAG: hypothetical protein AAFQ20_11050 [Bacteroidota bacterium]
MNTNTKTVPTWYWVVCTLLFLWNVMGVGSFFHHLFISPEALSALPENEQLLYTQLPLWAKITFAFAVFGGLLGCLALLLRKKWAVMLLQISLLGVLIQMFHTLFISNIIEVYGPSAMVMPILVIGIAFVLVWFSRFALKKSWLR